MSKRLGNRAGGRRSVFAAGVLVCGASAALGQSQSRAIFVCNNGNLEGSVTAFRVSATDQLEFVNRVVTGSRPSTNDPCAGCNSYEISLSPSGRWLATSHPAGVLDGITIYEVAADATLTQAFQLPLGAGVGGPLDLVWLDDERIAYTRGDATPDRAVIYRWLPDVPNLQELGGASLPSGAGMSYMAVNPDRTVLYFQSSTLDTVYAYAIGAGGTLTFIDAEITDPTFPLELAISPDGGFLYAAGGISNGSNKVIALEIGGDGSLSPVAGTPFISPGASPSNVFVSGNGEYLIVGHGTDATMRAIRRNTSSGALGDQTGFFDVGGQGTLGDVSALDDLVFVTDNSTALDGLTGIYVFRLESDGALTQLGPIVSTGGIAPRSIAVWSPPSSGLLGDMNCDGIVSVADIGPFVLALTDPAGYAAQFPDCDALNGDLNEDGFVTVGDIGAFVALLTGP